MSQSPEYRLAQAHDALGSLRLALRQAKAADSPRLVEVIRRAIKSAGGAIRHAQGREQREHY